MAQAEQLRSKGRYREALAAFQDAYRLSPSAPPLRAAAELHRAFGDDAAAHRAYATLLSRHRAEMSEESQRAAEQALRQLELLTGTIAITGFAPGATVTINGALVATTPLSGAVRVNPGQYTVTVARSGFQTLTRTVQVGSGEVSVSGPLQPQVSVGDVSVFVDLPVVTQLHIDGRPVGSLPWRGHVTQGEHTFQAVGSSHQSAPVRVTVRAGPQSLRLALSGRLGWVVVQTGNSSARIMIDGSFVGYGYWQGELMPGQHELRIELAGYEPHTEVFTLQAGAQIVLDRGAQLRPVGARPPERAPPVEPAPPREPEPEAEDKSVGVYGAILFSGTFGVSSTHQYESNCPVVRYGGSCATTAPRGGGLGLRLGYSLGIVGIEGLLIGGADVSFAQATLPVTLSDPTLQRFAQESSYVRVGWAPGLGLRLTSAPSALRVTAGGTLAYAFRTVYGLPDSLEGETSIGYKAPALVFDGGILLGSNPGAKLYLAVFVWFEFSGNVTLQRNLSALGPAAQLVPADLAQVDVYQGTQVFWGPLVGICFGH